MGSRGHATTSLVERADRAQYFTPPGVCEFVWQAVRLLAGAAFRRRWRLIDPAAGRGAFLEVALAPGRLAADGVVGVELDPCLVGEPLPGARPARRVVGDGLSEGLDGVAPAGFDLVLGNPPFGRAGRVFPPELLSRWLQEQRLHASYEVCRIVTGARPGRRPDPRTMPVELLFVERCLQLARPGGLVGLVLPEGFATNDRLRPVRDWVLARAEVLGVVGLPASVFRRSRLNARTVAVFLRRRPTRRPEAPAFLAAAPPSASATEGFLAEVLRQWGRARVGRRPEAAAGFLCLPARRLRGQRWDARSWLGRWRQESAGCRFPTIALGDCIELLTYGPIVTGQRPVPQEDGVVVVRQCDFRETGLCLDRALRVAPGGVYDPDRSRVRARDLLLPRSGWGSLGRNRMAVYTAAEPANVGCFVDLIRLARLNPFYVWLHLRTAMGWGQIRSLINGVGTPNINFAEIRSLRIPAVPEAAQTGTEERYRRQVWPLHCLGEADAGARTRAAEALRRLVADLEAYVRGDRRRLSASR